MAIEPERKDVAQERNRTMPSDYGSRAAIALDRLVPGPHRDKTIARMFNVSIRMAQYLRRGQFWTTDRLSQASAQLGADFDRMLSIPSRSEIFARIDCLEQELDDLRNILRGEDEST